MERFFITQAAAVCNLGKDLNEIYKNAVKGKLLPHKIDIELPEIENPDYDIRCNRILLHCLNSLKTDDIVKKRVGVVIGTTNSGIEEYETTQNMKHAQFGNPAEFIHKYLNLNGFYASVSTACTSGLKAVSTGIKLLKNNICDVVIVGGSEPLASLPHYGFKSLEVLSDKLSNPFSANRCGMNIGEGGALFVLEKNVFKGIEILAIGESSDAYHSATPEPTAVQAKNAINQALNQAGLKPCDIDYINLHGTGTVSNDLMEANAVYDIFGKNVYASSTKPLTGHCLGAAASIEIALCYQMLLNNEYLLPHIYDGEYDSKLPQIKLVPENTKADRLKICMSNSFGFGGTNGVVILGKPDISKILPHNHPMIFIDDIEEVNLDYVICKTKITKDKIFFINDGIPYIAGIEFMAQTIGCYSYFYNKCEEPKIGFLLGTRLYKNNIEKFEENETYTIKAVKVFSQEKLVSFECFIYNGDILCANAIINAYQPDSTDEFLENDE